MRIAPEITVAGMRALIGSAHAWLPWLEVAQHRDGIDAVILALQAVVGRQLDRP